MFILDLHLNKIRINKLILRQIKGKIEKRRRIKCRQKKLSKEILGKKWLSQLQIMTI